jgi:hypothetical protein
MQLTVGPGNFSSNASDIVTFGTLLYAAQVVLLECNCYRASSKCDPSNSPVSTTSSTPLVAAGLTLIHTKQSQLTVIFLFYSKSKSDNLCFDAGGSDISDQFKRGIGVQLAVTITYTNLCV